jgi:hypothetical protein
MMILNEMKTVEIRHIASCFGVWDHCWNLTISEKSKGV